MRTSEIMKLASIWCVWGFIALGSLVWGLFVVLDYFGVKEQAGWAQAVGAIIAVVGAAAFPYWHEAEKDRRKSERLRQVLLLLAGNQQEQLRLLYSTLFNASVDFGERTLTPYLENGWHLKWPPHIEALSSIPITDLDPGQVHMLGEMKVGAAFAWSICERLNSWEIWGEREQLEIKRLHHYWEMACLTVELLKQKGGAAAG